MRICFNVRATGLANNGGSRTLIRCVENLRAIGVDAFFWGNRNTYTWHKCKPKIIRGKTLPPCDVVVATGCATYGSTAVTKVKLKTAYVRGLEVWKAPEKRLLSLLKSLDCVFVNSEWLLEYMRSHDIESHLQYPGIDVDVFSNQGRADRDGVGGLFHGRHRTKKHKHVYCVCERIGVVPQMLNKSIRNASPSNLNDWFNRLKVWLAPTELEGLHNPPIEASLAGCALVCTDHPRSGMQDYAVDGETALVYPAGDLDAAAERVRELLRNEDMRVRLNQTMVARLHDKFGSRESQMRLFASQLGSMVRENRK